MNMEPPGLKTIAALRNSFKELQKSILTVSWSCRQKLSCYREQKQIQPGIYMFYIIKHCIQSICDGMHMREFMFNMFPLSQP